MLTYVNQILGYKFQWNFNVNTNIWVRSRRCACLVTWFCYQVIAKPGNKTAAPSIWPDPDQYFLSRRQAISQNLNQWSPSSPAHWCVTRPQWLNFDESHVEISLLATPWFPDFRQASKGVIRPSLYPCTIINSILLTYSRWRAITIQIFNSIQFKMFIVITIQLNVYNT